MWHSNLEWRTEIWHAVIVHFPVVTMTFASLAGLVKYFTPQSRLRTVASQLFTVMLILAVLSGWLAIYTGQLSYNVVVREICDPPALQEHQRWSFATAYIYTAVLLVAAFSLKIKARLPKLILNSTIILGLLAGAYTLFTAGHLGAAAVYQQGAGVESPDENCRRSIQD